MTKMSDNPYESPKAELGSGHVVNQAAELQQLAADYLAINLNLSLSVVCHGIFILFLCVGAPPEGTGLIVGMVALASLIHLVGLSGIATRLYHPIVGLALSLFVITPFIGLLTQFVFRRRAIALLEDRAVLVGPFYVDEEDFAARVRYLTERTTP